MIQKWTLLSSKDVSPNSWFPIESRTYKLPNGKIVEDFTVTTIADVAMVVPVTKEGKLVLVRQYKPGVDEITIEFPAGRIETYHTDPLDAARHELEEETGIRTDNLEQFGAFAAFTTKGSERINLFLARDVEFNSVQKFDANEEIEVLLHTPKELEQMIDEGQIISAQAIAIFYLAKRKFPELFS